MQAQIMLPAPSLTLHPKSDLSDFGQLISGRTRVNPSSAAGGGGNTPRVRHSRASSTKDDTLAAAVCGGALSRAV